jgi:single-stranded-DNA-specific exonuclease
MERAECEKGKPNRRSAMPKKWIIPPPAMQCETFARQWRVPPVVAQLLINRGLSPDQPCDGFLLPQLRDLYPPELLPGVTEAARRIADAVHEKRRIVLYGDYDVDGTTGVAILWHVLRLAGVRDVTLRRRGPIPQRVVWDSCRSKRRGRRYL